MKSIPRSSQEPMASQIIDPKRKPATIILLNGQTYTLLAFLTSLSLIVMSINKEKYCPVLGAMC